MSGHGDHGEDRPGEEALLDYIAGRLPGPDRAAIDRAAAEDPDLAAELAVMQGLRNVMQQDQDDLPPGELGWKRLERAMAAQDAQDAQTRGLAPAPSPAVRRTPTWAVAAGAAVAAVIGWQFLATPLIDGPGAGYGTASGPAAAAFVLTVGFAPQATEAELRGLLDATGGRIVDGPSALGLWQVAYDDDAARAAALQTFADSPALVAHVQAD